MTDDEVRLWREVYLLVIREASYNSPGYAADYATDAVRRFREARQTLALEAAR